MAALSEAIRIGEKDSPPCHPDHLSDHASRVSHVVQNSTFEDSVKGSIFERKFVTAALQQYPLGHAIGFRLLDHCGHGFYAAYIFSAILEKANTPAGSGANIEEGPQSKCVADHLDVLEGQVVGMVLAADMHGVRS